MRPGIQDQACCGSGIIFNSIFDTRLLTAVSALRHETPFRVVTVGGEIGVHAILSSAVLLRCLIQDLGHKYELDYGGDDHCGAPTTPAEQSSCDHPLLKSVCDPCQ